MMRTLWVGLVAAATICLVSIATAKGPERAKPVRQRVCVPRSLSVALSLMELELVRKDIGLTESQMAKAIPLMHQLDESYDKIYRDNPMPPPDPKTPGGPRKSRENKDGSTTWFFAPPDTERERRVARAMREVDEKFEKRLEQEQILLPAQLDRLWEILLQLESFLQSGGEIIGGIMRIDLDWELGKLLEMSDDQRLDAMEIRQKVSEAQDQIILASFRELEKQKMPKAKRKEIMHKQIAQCWPVVRDGNAKILAILTPKQRELVAGMRGKEIDWCALFEQAAELEGMFDDPLEAPSQPQPAPSPAR